MMRNDGNVFDSGLSTVKQNVEVVVYYPPQYLSVIQQLNKELGSLEYSFFGQVREVRSQGNRVYVYLTEDVFIPKQRVTYSQVEYLEPPPPGWDVVVHRHPWSSGSFSSTDEEYINSNARVSLLILDDTISEGIVSIKDTALWLIMQLKANVALYVVTLPEVAISVEEKIEKYAPSPSQLPNWDWRRWGSDLYYF